MSKVYPVEIIEMTIEEWLSVSCAEGDLLKVLKTDGAMGLLNQRTNVLYLIPEAKT